MPSYQFAHELDVACICTPMGLCLCLMSNMRGRQDLSSKQARTAEGVGSQAQSLHSQRGHAAHSSDGHGQGMKHIAHTHSQEVEPSRPHGLQPLTHELAHSDARLWHRLQGRQC